VQIANGCGTSGNLLQIAASANFENTSSKMGPKAERTPGAVEIYL